jgi:alpha-beta hydrolase superfamily lysophospholipase
MQTPGLTTSIKKLILRTAKIVFIFYTLLCIALYFLQEKLIFLPEKLEKDLKYSFAIPFDERTIQTTDGKLLNGLLFKADSSKGLIFYLHGNAGSLERWGAVAGRYTKLNYDVFMLDYRGYGKSEGSIQNQQQLFEDIQTAYNEVKKEYNETNIIIIGYSIGTGLAAKLASDNHPKRLILQAPYYSLTDMMKHRFPIIPTFLLRYKIETVQYLNRSKIPTVLFHGDADKVIYYGSSVKLKTDCKTVDTLITLAGEGHNGMTDNPQYIEAIQKLLQ